MRISVDRRRCEGHGLCEAAAPDLLRLDDDALVLLLDDRAMPADQQQNAERAVRVCPIAALSLLRDP